MTTQSRPPLFVLLILSLSLIGSGLIWWQFERSNDLMSEQVLVQTEQRSLQLADAMANQIDGLLGSVDLGLLQLRETWLTQDARAFDAQARIILNGLPRDLVSHLSIVNADGYRVYNSLSADDNAYFGDHALFSVLRASGDRVLVSPPVHAPLLDTWAIVIARPIQRDGSFAGAIFMTLKTDAIATRLARVQLDKDDTITLLHANGAFMARSQDNQQAMGKHVAAGRPFLVPGAPAHGTFRMPGTLDQVSRIFSWQRLERFELFMVVGLAEHAVMAPLVAGVHRDRAIKLGMVVLVLVLGAIVAFLLVREMQRRGQSEDALRTANVELASRVDAGAAALELQNLHNLSIIHAAMDGFFITDQHGRLLDSNAVYCAMLGYSRDEMLHFRIADLEAIEKPEEIAAHIDKIMRTGHDRFDTRHRRKDGSLLDVEVNVTMAELGGENFFYAFVHDISQRKQAEASLISARDEAERSNAAKSDFLSRMSHELRTPLNAIIGFAQLLEMSDRTVLGEQQADHVREILLAGRHLLAQINEVLDLSRIESGHIELKPAALPIARLADDCIAQLRPLADARSITIESTLDGQLTVLADATRVRQVLLNLLSNAIKYNHAGGTILITAMPDADNLRIEVQDSGRGIPPAQIDRLFKPFERLESAYDGIEGTGIGLALVKKLVEAMGGAIGVESTPGVGSRFWFSLPSTSLPVLASTVTPKVSDGATAPVTPGSAATRHVVLYIEDNPANLKLVRKLLGARPDIELIDATTAAAGLELAQERAPFLILLDLNLPDMDGFSAMRLLRANQATRDIPVIAISANAMRHEIERGRAAGFADYLTKPLDIQNFIKTIEHCLASHKKDYA